jgi:hypothetical protein
MYSTLHPWALFRPLGLMARLGAGRSFQSEAPSRYRIVTNSSAELGWMATVASKSALVAPILTAIATP